MKTNLRFYYEETNARVQVAIVDKNDRCFIQDAIYFDSHIPTLESAIAEDYSGIVECETVEEIAEEIGTNRAHDAILESFTEYREECEEFFEPSIFTEFIPLEASRWD